MAVAKNITGQEFRNLTAVRFSYRENKRTFWFFKCICGKEKLIDMNSVVRKNSSVNSCGCVRRKMGQGKAIDIKGQKFGYLTAVRCLGSNARNRKVWACRCDCGGLTEATTGELRCGNRTTCGCKTYTTGSYHPSWKNGRARTTAGYIQIFKPKHPNSNKKGYILEHRLIMEKRLGRYLLPNENVHHINGVKDDNRPENLELWVSMQPAGQRPEDLVSYALEILKLYAPEKLLDAPHITDFKPDLNSLLVM